MQKEREDFQEYELKGEIQGYNVYIRHCPDGLTAREAWALFDEARKDLLFQSLAKGNRQDGE